MLYPRGANSGGPEALHQLVDSFSRQGFQAFLVPMPGTEKNERVAAFTRYRAPEASSYEDNAENLVLSFEQPFKLLRRVRHAQVAVWWLSIDFSSPFAVSRLIARGSDGKSIFVAALRQALLSRSFWAYWAHPSWIRERVWHFTQSEYARQFLKSRGIESSPLSDYVTATPEPRSGESSRRRVIAVNPAKGFEHVAQIRALRPDYQWVELRGMSRTEVDLALQESEIYLDLGHHPGKDRIPREAALSGANVIVARRNGAEHWVDVQLPDRFKIEVGPGLAEAAVRLIDEIFRDPLGAYAEQETYRGAIGPQEKAFDNEVRDLAQRLGL